MAESELLTPGQVAERLHVRPRTVRRWLKAGRLGGLKLGTVWGVRAHDLDVFLRFRDRRKSERTGSESPRPSDAEPARAVEAGEKILALFDHIWQQVPEQELARLPEDLAEQHDHYLYGLPRRAL